jgi:hypothetical protein
MVGARVWFEHSGQIVAGIITAKRSNDDYGVPPIGHIIRRPEFVDLDLCSNGAHIYGELACNMYATFEDACAARIIKTRRTEMIDSDKIKIGDTVWFDNGGQIEKGRIAGWAQQAHGPIVFNVRKEIDHKGFSPILEGWQVYNLYETKLDCLRDMLKGCDIRVNDLGFQTAQLELRSKELAAQIKAEEEKTRTPKAKIVWFRCRGCWDVALVKLPVPIETPIRDRVGDGPVMIRTDHVVVRWHNRLQRALIYLAIQTGEVLGYGKLPYKSCAVPKHGYGIETTRHDVCAAVKFLGFELEDN